MPVRSEIFGKSGEPSASQLARRALDEAGHPMTVEELWPRLVMLAENGERSLPPRDVLPRILVRRSDWFVAGPEPGTWWLADEPIRERPAPATPKLPKPERRPQAPPKRPARRDLTHCAEFDCDDDRYVTPGGTERNRCYRHFTRYQADYRARRKALAQADPA